MGLCASKEDRSGASKVGPVTRRTENTQDTHKHPEVPSKTKTNAGKTVGSPGESEKEASARRAAGLAAAERLEKLQNHSGKGELSKKLAEERSKTLKTHLKETAESRQLEKNQALVYD
ncbi:LANO_0F01860g1_1 [Lachancea nothofagi CBS 11611]|uniref:LANO_0F01860g1_1 n=1 Tax=Lachancea nothofagi CBS 11611 TaxID=1266666 RepID=A0A1G4K6J4_9SACH|nr:LANO_0F01860g1_1 [Lachancea nothofagi CBS 11611]